MQEEELGSVKPVGIWGEMTSDDGVARGKGATRVGGSLMWPFPTSSSAPFQNIGSLLVLSAFIGGCFRNTSKARVNCSHFYETKNHPRLT